MVKVKIWSGPTRDCRRSGLIIRLRRHELTTHENIANLAGIIIPETDMVRAMMGTHPSSLIFNKNTGRVSSDIGIHKTLAIVINSFLEEV